MPNFYLLIVFYFLLFYPPYVQAEGYSESLTENSINTTQTLENENTNSLLNNIEKNDIINTANQLSDNLFIDSGLIFEKVFQYRLPR